MTQTPTTTEGQTPTPTEPVPACASDCDNNRVVTVNELVKSINIALGKSNLTTCPAADTNDDGKVTVDELVSGVNNSLSGCPR